jgi:hypothetical protein
MKKVVILGCGPAGLLAAHAANLLRMQPKIYALMKPSVINGAQFVHGDEAIHGLECGEPSVVTYSKLGTRDGYAQKVYGSADAPCSWDSFPEGDQKAWSMHDIYQTLWALYSDAVTDLRVFGSDIAPLEKEYDLVISTIPRMTICVKRHDFTSQRVLFREGVPFRREGNWIEYNGEPTTPYYRTSSLFGHASTEFGEVGSWTVPPAGLQQGIKPLGHDCDCHPKTKFVGRFGRWEKGVLVHHAFQEAFDALQSL